MSRELRRHPCQPGFYSGGPLCGKSCAGTEHARQGSWGFRPACDGVHAVDALGRVLPSWLPWLPQYLQYKNVRPDYLREVWKVINWAEAGKRYEEAAAKSGK